MVQAGLLTAGTLGSGGATAWHGHEGLGPGEVWPVGGLRAWGPGCPVQIPTAHRHLADLGEALDPQMGSDSRAAL